MTTAETFGIAGFIISGLLAIAGVLIGVIWSLGREDRKSMVDRVKALESQNATQERELATLRANHDAHEDSMTDLRAEIRSMNGKLDQVLIALGRRATPYTAGESGSGRKT
jgi:uncharacterized coiled-coil protein SlyX